MKKRLLALALAVVMVCGLLPVTATAAATVTEIVPPKYEKVGDFHDGLAWVATNGKWDYMSGQTIYDEWGFIDTTGKEVVPLGKYDRVKDFSEGLAAVSVFDEESEGYKWGFIDTTGKEVVPCKYTNYDVPEFHEGLAAVELDRKWGFIDTTGKEVVPCALEYWSVGNFHEGLAAVQIGEYPNEKWGFIDTTGKEVIPCKYDSVGAFSDGLAAVALATDKKDENGGTIYKWGFIDKTGKEVVPCKYDDYFNNAPVFHEGLAAVRLATDEKDRDGNTIFKGGLIDTTGKEVVPLGKYYWVKEFSEGLARVHGRGDQIKYGRTVNGEGFIDATGKEVIPCNYTDAGNFSEGLAAVSVGDWETKKYGFIDKTGKEVIPCKYDSVGAFSDGLAQVHLNNKYGLIDKTGKEVVPIGKYNEVRSLSEGLVAVDEYGKGWGCIDLHGNEVIPCQYGGVKLLSAGMVAVLLDDKWGVLRVEGLPTEPKPAPAPTPSPTPQQPATPASTTAYASTQTVTVDGKPVTFYAYALKDANGNDTNYIKLRDVAQILNGSAAQFQVGWDGSITITTKTAYTPNGTENIQNFKGNQTYTVNTSPVTVNGQPTNLEAITLTDASGGGYTYFKLRDLGAALGFDVDWTPEKGITVDSTKPYDGNN